MNKRNLRISMLLLALGLFLAGCGGDDDDNPTNPGNGGNGTGGVNMSAKVDGAAWQAITANAIDNGGVIIVGSSNATGEIGIGFGFQNTGPGTYTIGPGQIANATVTSASGTIWIASGDVGSGTIVITTLTSERVAGTFTFSADRSIGTENPATRVVTEGTFDLPFLE